MGKVIIKLFEYDTTRPRERYDFRHPTKKEVTIVIKGLFLKTTEISKKKNNQD